MREILAWGLDDWVDLGFARQYVGDEIGGVTSVELREQTLAVLSDLIRGGLFVPGDLTRAGFTPWPLEPEASIARIRAEWDVADDPLHPGAVCWLQITEDGKALARLIDTDR